MSEDKDTSREPNLNDLSINGEDLQTAQENTAVPTTNPTTPRFNLTAEKEVLESTPYSLLSVKYENNVPKIGQDSPGFMTDHTPMNGMHMNDYMSSFSPPFSKLMSESYLARSPYAFRPLSNPLLQSAFTQRPLYDDNHSNPALQNDSSNIMDKDMDKDNDMYLSARPMLSPTTPRYSNSNPPLFNNLYYSPINSGSFPDRPLFSNAADRTSDVSLRDMRLTLHGTPSNMMDSDIDFSSINLGNQATWSNHAKTPMLEESPKKSDEPRCTMFRFNSESMDDKEKQLEGSETPAETGKPADLKPIRPRIHHAVDIPYTAEDDNSYEDDDSHDSQGPTTTTAHLKRHETRVTRASRNSRGNSEHPAVKKTPSEDSRKKAVKRNNSTSESRATSEVPPPVSLPSNDSVLLSTHPCNCKKSRCLKLYCECFSTDTYCNGCNCLNCLNNLEHKREREEAKQQLLIRNTNAFKPRVVGDADSARVNVKGCNCKKTGCLKKYCECFQSGIPCGQNCKCIDCRNTEEMASAIAKRMKVKEEVVSKPEEDEDEDEDFMGQNV